MKRFVALLLAVLMLLSFAATAAGFKNLQVYRCNEYVTLRKFPDTSSRALDRVLYGEVVRGEKDENGFYHCYYNNQEGYILGKYLTSNIETFSEPYTFRVVNCRKNISLREFPKSGAKVLRTIPKGAKVTAFYHDDSYDEDGFVYVEYKGQGGFAKWAYLDY